MNAKFVVFFVLVVLAVFVNAGPPRGYAGRRGLGAINRGPFANIYIFERAAPQGVEDEIPTAGRTLGPLGP